jgi:hypothetical protein
VARSWQLKLNLLMRTWHPSDVTVRLKALLFAPKPRRDGTADRTGSLEAPVSDDRRACADGALACSGIEHFGSRKKVNGGARGWYEGSGTGLNSLTAEGGLSSSPST